MPDKKAVIDQTRKWLSTVIIEHSLCPFAQREYDADRIHYAVIETSELPVQLERLIMECAALDRDADRETSLLIFPTAFPDFDDYLVMLELANALLVEQGYEGVYQLASFHPDYRFDGAEREAASNYTNRSPYPIVHILREASVEAALKTYPNPENIPARNIKLTEELGLEVMKQLLAYCYK